MSGALGECCHDPAAQRAEHLKKSPLGQRGWDTSCTWTSIYLGSSVPWLLTSPWGGTGQLPATASSPDSLSHRGQV